jgi:hypothetical protein
VYAAPSSVVRQEETVLPCAPDAAMLTASVLRVRTYAPNRAAIPAVASAMETPEMVGATDAGTRNVNVQLLVDTSFPFT